MHNKISQIQIQNLDHGMHLKPYNFFISTCQICCI